MPNISSRSNLGPGFFGTLVLFLLTFFLSCEYGSLYFAMDDEAVTVLGAQRLLAGETPYRDFATRHCPGSYYFSAAYFAIFGSEQWGTRSLMCLVAALTGLLIHLISLRCIRGKMRFMPWLLWTCCGLVDFPILSYHWFGTLFTVASVLMAWGWVTQSSPWWARGLGLSSSLALWTLQSDGFASALIIVFLGLRFRPPNRLTLLRWTVGCSILLWLPLFPLWGQIWRESVVDLRIHLPYNRFPYSWHPLIEMFQANQGIAWTQDPQLWGTAWSHWWLNVLRYGTFYGVLVISLLFSEWKRHREGKILAWCMLAWALAIGNRQVISYLGFACPIYYLVLCQLLSHLPRAGILAALWAGIEILGWGCRASFKVRSHQFPVQTRSGLYWTQSPQVAQRCALLHAMVEKYLPPGTEVLGYPYLASLYTLEKLRNPIRFSVLSPFVFSDEDHRLSVDRLKERKVRWIVYQALSASAISRLVRIPEEVYIPEAQRRLEQVTQGYRPVAGAPGLQLFERKEP